MCNEEAFPWWTPVADVARWRVVVVRSEERERERDSMGDLLPGRDVRVREGRGLNWWWVRTVQGLLGRWGG